MSVVFSMKLKIVWPLMPLSFLGMALNSVKLSLTLLRLKQLACGSSTVEQSQRLCEPS